MGKRVWVLAAAAFVGYFVATRLLGLLPMYGERWILSEGALVKVLLMTLVGVAGGYAAWRVTYDATRPAAAGPMPSAAPSPMEGRARSRRHGGRLTRHEAAAWKSVQQSSRRLKAASKRAWRRVRKEVKEVRV